MTFVLWTFIFFFSMLQEVETGEGLSSKRENSMETRKHLKPRIPKPHLLPRPLLHPLPLPGALLLADLPPLPKFIPRFLDLFINCSWTSTMSEP